MIKDQEKQASAQAKRTSMADYLSPKVRGIKPSGIRRFFDLANGRKDIITLGVGEPDFVTPWHVREASVYALEMGKTQYTSNAGTPGFREEIGCYLHSQFDVSYDPASEIVVYSRRQ